MLKSDETSRREFVSFFGRSTAAVAGGSMTGVLTTQAFASKAGATPKAVPLVSTKPTNKDEVVLADGLKSQVLLTQGQIINKKNESFGDCNDFIAFVPDKLDPEHKALMWVNHEAFTPFALHGFGVQANRSKDDMAKERQSVGGSIVAFERDRKSGEWQPNLKSARNRRISAETEIPFAAGVKIMGAKSALGTVSNCSGGTTPWATVLSCEENYHDFYGEVAFSLSPGSTKSERRKIRPSVTGWETHFDHPPEHYGWVVEVDPTTGAARKHTSMGRFAHEGATVVTARDGRPVVYLGDDAKDQCIYKFIGDRAGSLDSGTLFVADLNERRWIPLTVNGDPRLKGAFADQLDLLIRTREAAKMVGGTPCDRPEDIEVDAQTGVIIIALTNNADKGNHHGSLLRIQEKDGNFLATTFQTSTLLAGGEGTGFSCPDNLVFDKQGNLWMTSDISSGKVGKTPYQSFGNNGLFVIPFSGPNSGKAIQVASAPVEAEFTGPCFSPDGRTLFLSVQHPGEESKDAATLTSHWPVGGTSIPRSAVIAITGPLLDSLVGSQM